MTIKSVIISSILVTFICDSEEILKGEIRKRKKAIHVHVCKPQAFLRELTVHPGCWIAVSLREETRFGSNFFLNGLDGSVLLQTEDCLFFIKAKSHNSCRLFSQRNRHLLNRA